MSQMNLLLVPQVAIRESFKSRLIPYGGVLKSLALSGFDWDCFLKSERMRWQPR